MLLAAPDAGGKGTISAVTLRASGATKAGASEVWVPAGVNPYLQQTS